MSEHSDPSDIEEEEGKLIDIEEVKLIDMGVKTTVKIEKVEGITEDDIKEKEAVGRSNVGGLLPLVPYFSGEPNTTSVQDFIKALQSAARLGNWTNRMLVTVLKQRLVGGASDYLNSNPEFDLLSWEQLRETFIRWFRQAPSSEDPLQAFYQCTQRPGESAKLYLTRLKLAGVAASSPFSGSSSEFSQDDPNYILTRNLVNKALVRTFLKGLREESGGSIISLHNPKGIEEALALAEEFEYQKRNKQRIRFLQGIDEPMNHIAEVKSTLTSQPPQIQISQNKPKPPYQSNMSQSNHAQNPNQRFQRTSVTCFRCGGQGHYANVCSSPKDPEAPPTTRSSQNSGNNPQKNRNYNQGNVSNRSQVSCEFCRKNGHTADICRLRQANYAMQHSFEQDNRNYSQPQQTYAQALRSNSPDRNLNKQSGQTQQTNFKRESDQQNFENRSS